MSLASSVGLASGINFDEIISKMRSVNTRPMALVQQSQQKIAMQRNALQSVNKALADFKSKIESLVNRSSFLSISSASSDYSVVSATATNEAVSGNYSVKVQQLAQNHRIASQGFSSLEASIASTEGSFEFKVGDGSTTSIALTAGMTLQQLRDAINTSTDTKVRASVINDGTATNPYRLVLTADATGAANTIAITSNGSLMNLSTRSIEPAVAREGNTFNGAITASGTYTGATTRNIIIEMTSAGGVGAAKYKVSTDGGLTWSANDAFTTSADDIDVTGTMGVNVRFAEDANPVGFAVGDRFTIDAFAPELQAARNALIEVDGIQVSRPTNEFTDVIDHLTLTARKVDEDVQTITVSNSNSNVTGKINDFIKAYNTLVNEIKNQTKYDPEKKTAAPLFGDSGVNSILSNLRSIVTGVVQGTGTYSSLSTIGISVDKDGMLSADQSKITAIMDDDLDAVMNLFIQAGKSSNTDVQFVNSTRDTAVGVYSVNVTTAATQANIQGSQTLGPGGLGTAEGLIISLGEKAINVTFAAGTTLGAIIDRLNQAFSDNKMGMQAASEDGRLKISSTAYGSEQSITVTSTQAAGLANQLGLGTLIQTAMGVDVAGTINGVAAVGSGQTLKGGDLTEAKGLELLINSRTPTTASVNLTQGVALQALGQIENLTDSKTGFFTIREQRYTSQDKDYEQRLEALSERLTTQETQLRKQFTALESKLAAMQTQSNYLNTQLASLIG